MDLLDDDGLTNGTITVSTQGWHFSSGMRRYSKGDTRD